MIDHRHLVQDAGWKPQQLAGTQQTHADMVFSRKATAEAVQRRRCARTPANRIHDQIRGQHPFASVGASPDECTGDAIPRRVFAQLIGEGQSDPFVQRELRENLVAPRRELIRAIWDRGVARGELRTDVDLEAAFDLVFGPLLYRLLISHAPLDEAGVDAIVDAMRGLAPGD
jgi:Tetracyclin repressor-like, C-terminal domain